MHLRLMTVDDLDNAVEFVARLQADPTQIIAYFGTEPDDIRHTLHDFEPDWMQATPLIYDGERLVGLLGVDASEIHEKACYMGRWWTPQIGQQPPTNCMRQHKKRCRIMCANMSCLWMW